MREKKIAKIIGQARVNSLMGNMAGYP